MYLKLVKARDTDLAADLIDYDGEETPLLDCYVPAATEDGDYVYAESPGCIQTKTLTVCMSCDSEGRTSCWTNEAWPIRDDDGVLWLDEHDLEEAFC
jgi:hypothetical protein